MMVDDMCARGLPVGLLVVSSLMCIAAPYQNHLSLLQAWAISKRAR